MTLANTGANFLDKNVGNDKTVNVTGTFYNEVIRPTFKNTSGIVYIIPEVYSIEKVFGTEAYHFSQW